jgi:hypothetical protein
MMALLQPAAKILRLDIFIALPPGSVLCRVNGGPERTDSSRCCDASRRTGNWSAGDAKQLHLLIEGHTRTPAVLLQYCGEVVQLFRARPVRLVLCTSPGRSVS